MFKFIKRNKKQESKTTTNAELLEKTVQSHEPESQHKPEGDEIAPNNENETKKASLRERLKKSRQTIGGTLGQMFRLKKAIDDDLLEEIETDLILADIGVAASTEIIANLTASLKRKQLRDHKALYESLKSQLEAMLAPAISEFDINNKAPFVILMIGVNGAGKTTTIGKLAKKYKAEGKKVMLAAGDTFRAAAVEQLQAWGERNDVPVIAQHTGADSASVIFDALQSAKAKNIDILIADTAGRLHTQDNLMEELVKVKRVLSKLDAEAPHETMLVIDGSTGQNALNQAKQFHQSIGLTGMSITKLDGTAKGGVVFALARELKLPVRFIGVGEKASDLRTFKASEFVDAVLPPVDSL